MATIQKIIEDSILQERSDFFSLPTGFVLRDILPWKFTRQYSFIRRPIIQITDTLYWGSRNVNFLAHEELGLIYNCKLKTEGKPRVEKIQGLISEERSKFFNDSVFKKLSGYVGFLVKENIKKDSQGKRLTDDTHNDLGDIDVLAIDTRYRIIYVIEVKNYQFSRNNPDEIFLELQKVKKYHKKHIRRVHWICEHIQNVCSLFGINEITEFKIKEAMVTKAPVLAKHLLDKSINIIAEYELSEKKLHALPTVKAVRITN